MKKQKDHQMISWMLPQSEQRPLWSNATKLDKKNTLTQDILVLYSSQQNGIAVIGMAFSEKPSIQSIKLNYQTGLQL